jgi:putative protein kinase ArgK-like GTPase of G3E family
MKGCIVSMEYKTKNNDGKQEVAALAESYKDADKVKDLFEKTLRWDSKNVSTFKDSNVGIKNVFNNINKHIYDLKAAASLTATDEEQQLNIFAFIGHGVINEKD